MKKSLLVLLILVLVTSFSLYAGGKTEETPTMETKVSEKEELVNSQAPELKELVDKGELPPLKERLPKPDDIFIEEADEIGVYGGTWDLVWRGIDDKWWAGAIAAEGLFHFGPDGKTLYITEGWTNAIYRVKTNQEGLPLYHETWKN